MYYVIEHQIKPDGTVNVSETGRTTFNLGKSLYHERYSKMCATTIYKKVALMLVDEEMNIFASDCFATEYAEGE